MLKISGAFLFILNDNHTLFFMKPIFIVVLLASLLFTALISCNTEINSDDANQRIRDLENQVAELKSKAYIPELGDMMLGIQAHHTKLFYAGSAGNWALADFFVEELGEQFEKVEQYHPKDEGINIAQLIPSLMEPALDSMDKAIDSKNPTEFIEKYALLTTSCNNCHEAAAHPFVFIIQPAPGDFVNQKF